MTEHTNISEAGDILDNAVPGFGSAKAEDPVVTVQVSLSALRALVGEAKVAEFMSGGVRPFKLVRSTVVKATWPLAPKTMWTLEAL
jgi:hypothetical protein